MESSSSEGFPESLLRSKLEQLVSGETTIEELVEMMIVHRRDHCKIVQIWLEEFSSLNGQVSDQLLLMDLASKVIKTGINDIMDSFVPVILEALNILAQSPKTSTKIQVTYFLCTWIEEELFDSTQMQIMFESYQMACDYHEEARIKNLKNSNATLWSGAAAGLGNNSTNDETVDMDITPVLNEMYENMGIADDQIPSTSSQVSAMPALPSISCEMASLDTHENHFVTCEFEVSSSSDNTTDIANILLEIEEANLSLEKYHGELNTKRKQTEVISSRFMELFDEQKKFIQDTAEQRFYDTTNDTSVLQNFAKQIKDHVANLPTFDSLSTFHGDIPPLPAIVDLYRRI